MLCCCYLPASAFASVELCDIVYRDFGGLLAKTEERCLKQMGQPESELQSQTTRAVIRPHHPHLKGSLGCHHAASTSHVLAVPQEFATLQQVSDSVARATKTNIDRKIVYNIAKKARYLHHLSRAEIPLHVVGIPRECTFRPSCLMTCKTRLYP